MRWLKFKSIQNKIVFSVLAFMLVPIAALSYVKSKNTEAVIKENTVNMAFSTNQQITANVQQIINSVIVASNVVAMDAEVKDLLEDDRRSNPFDQYQKHRKIVGKLTSALGIILKFNVYVTLIDSRGNIYTTSNMSLEYGDMESAAAASWYREVMAMNGRILWIAPHQNYIAEERQSGKDFISLARVIHFDQGTASKAVLLISIYIDEVERFIERSMFLENEGYAIINTRGEVVLTNRKMGELGGEDLAFLLERMADRHQGDFVMDYRQEKMQVVFTSLNNPGWKSVYLIPYDNLMKPVRQPERTTVFFLLFIVMGFTAVLVYISYAITKPVKKLAAQMNKVKYGQFNVRAQAKSDDEVGVLAHSFNHMVVGIERLMERVKREEKEKKEAHFKALQAQINPHFLLNTLNAIKWTAYMEKVPHIASMVETLGKLFEFVVNKRSEHVAVEEEIEYLKSYATLMNIRYNRELDVQFHVDPEILKFKMLKFILQPIVENAIIHGFSGRAENKRIEIRGYPSGEDVVFEIRDNGIGMSAQKIGSILAENQETTGKDRITGIGISNVNERIKMNYGANYGVRISSAEREGTTVTVRIPKITNVEE